MHTAPTFVGGLLYTDAAKGCRLGGTLEGGAAKVQT